MKYPTDIDKYIADLRKRKDQLFLEYDEVDAELDELTEQLQMAEAVRAQIHIHFRYVTQDTGVDEQLRARFAHLSIKQMLVLLALEGGGILDLGKARQSLVRAGVFKDERNAATTMSPILSRHEETFRRVGRGTYVLISRPDPDVLAAYSPSADGFDYPISVLLGNPLMQQNQHRCVFGGFLEGARIDDE